MSNRTTFGVIALALGVLWLLANFELIQFPGFWGVVSVGFIALGAWQLVASNFREVGGGLTFLTLGTVIGLLQLDVISGSDIARIFWPAVLIIVGLTILLNRGGAPKGSSQDSDTRRLNIAHVFGGGKVVNTSNDFQGGEVVNLFGGGTIDLTQAEVSNKPARIAVTVLFGGSDLKLPESWNVENRTFALFGGSDDKRNQAKVESADHTPDLIISGIVLFGGLDIK